MRLRAPSFVPVRTALICCAVAMMTLAARPTGQGSSNYTVYTAEGRRNVSSKADAGIDFLPLEPLTSLLKLTIAEDPARGGLLIQGGGESILVIPNQSFVSLGQGRVVSLPGPVRRDGRTWLVPAEFVRLVLAPALGLRAEIRRPSRVILIGDLRMPQISGRVERSGINARLVVDVTPATPFRVTRNGNRLTVQFDAVAFEAASIGGTVPDLITGTRIQGTAILLTLGKSAMGYRVDETDRAHLVIEVAAPPPPPPPPPPPVPTPAPTAVPPGTQAPAPAAQAPPTIDVAPAGTLRTIVIDPGHGGEDAGVHGPGGALEKTVTLQLAKRLKTALESRLSLRTVLTRDDDRTVSADDRARIANTGKGDLFLSLHANASSQPTAAGIQVLSLAPEGYVSAAAKSEAPDVPVPVLGGGTRTITLAPSRAAQIPFVAQSTAFAEILARRLASLAGPAGTRPARQLPLRPLAGVHMPAVLIEAGFLSNPADEKALTTGDRAQKLIDALVGTIDDLRRGIPDQAPPAPATPVKP